ncbi:MAG: pyridoxal phosphate-dependent aminotransferase [Nitratireductor sp.]|nr:pyridoxal phosphate-dependent aminotransferase [Nitratireductor sp.]
MPAISKRISGILGNDPSGWEVHFTAKARQEAGEDIVMLSIGDHDTPTPEPSVEACVEELRAGHHHYTDLQGIAPLRAAMAAITQQSTGIATTADEVIVAPGGQGALFAAVHAALDPGDHAIVVGPYYATYPGTFRVACASFDVVEALAEDDFQPKREALEAAVRKNTRAVLINSPNNPTGAVYTRETLETLADFCKAHDLWLISDEVYWTHTGGKPHLSPLALPGMEARTLVVNSVSKSHGMTGWRVGWLRGPKEVVDDLVNLNLVLTYGLGDFLSRAVTRTLEAGWGVSEFTQRYARRREALASAFAGMRGAEVRGSQGGIYVMLDVRETFASGEDFAWELLEAEKIAVTPGEAFGKAAAGHVRISLCQNEETLAEAARRIRQFIETRAGSTKSKRINGAAS